MAFSQVEAAKKAQAEAVGKLQMAQEEKKRQMDQSRANMEKRKSDTLDQWEPDR